MLQVDATKEEEEEFCVGLPHSLFLLLIFMDGNCVMNFSFPHVCSLFRPHCISFNRLNDASFCLVFVMKWREVYTTGNSGFVVPNMRLKSDRSKGLTEFPSTI
jgi:hypothetical protein